MAIEINYCTQMVFYSIVLNFIRCGKDSGVTMLLLYLLLSREKDPAHATDLRKMRTSVL